MEKEQYRFITEEEYNDLIVAKDQLRTLGENLDKCIELLYPNFDYGLVANNFTTWVELLTQIQIDGCFHDFKWGQRKWFFEK